MGKKKQKRKMKVAAAAIAPVFCSCDDVPAVIAIQTPIPSAEKIMSFLLPKRSIVKTPRGEHRVCQVNTEADIILAVVPDKPRSCWKMVAW